MAHSLASTSSAHDHGPANHDHGPGHDHGHDHDEPHNDIIYPSALAFIVVHLVGIVGAFIVGITPTTLAICVGLYLLRMFAITAGYHRYFSHKSFSTSRVMQFVLAFVAQSSAQRGALWWASVHRHHHKHSDTEHDVHSPRHAGLWHSHVGWIWDRSVRDDHEYDNIPDLMRYPELVWLDKQKYLPAILLGLAVFLAAGLDALIVGFFLSTVVLYHGTFFINSLAHVIGTQRYLTGDDSRNNWWLAVITLGEGWHNNHHYYQASARQGFRWYEIDVTYYILKAMSWVGLVWDIKAPPKAIIDNARPLPRPVLERVAQQVAAGWDDSLDALCDQARRVLPVEALQDRASHTREQLRAKLDELPDLPSLDALRQYASDLFTDAPQLDAVVARARHILLDAIAERLASASAAPQPQPA
ncbi:MAG: acyl-CoA desaturase [Acidobacteriota bacterium]